MRHYSNHGHSGDPVYNSWSNMIQRCTNPKHPSYHRYGGRGVTVCTDWMTASKFIEWAYLHGFRVGLSIERIDNDKGYCPENCRWASRKEQQRNRSVNHTVTHNGVTRCLTEWAEILGMNPETLQYRLTRAGLTVEEAFTRPVQRRQTGPVVARRLETGTEKTFDSVADAARFFRINASNIQKCLNGEIHSAYGFSWRYAETAYV